MRISAHRRELSTFADVFLAVVAYLALLRVHIGPFPVMASWYLDLVPAIIAVWWLLSILIRSDVPYRLGSLPSELVEAGVINGAGAIFLLALSVLTKHDSVSRLVIAGFPVLSGLANAAIRLATGSWLAATRRRGKDMRHVLVVGPADTLPLVAPMLTRADSGLRPVGLLVPPDDAVTAKSPIPILGDFSQLEDVLHQHVVDQLAVTAAVDTPGFREVVQTATREGKTVWLMLDAFGARLVGRSGPGSWLVLSPEPTSVALAIKRLLDVAISAAALLAALPIVAACALAIKLDDPDGPVVFRQERIGVHGRVFTCFKFRSMVRDAEARRAALLGSNEMNGPVFKMREDPRITRVGRILRRYSLDEIPQFWNVLVGDMSLVGPRPPLPEEVRRYRPEFRRRLAFRPGLTCLWQVSGRNRVDFHDWMALDLRYVDNWTIWMDIVILLKTIPVVLFGSGM